MLESSSVSPVELPDPSSSLPLLVSITVGKEGVELTVGEVVLRPNEKADRWRRPGTLPAITPDGEASKQGLGSEDSVLDSYRYRRVCSQVAWRIFRFEQPADTLARLLTLSATDQS